MGGDFFSLDPSHRSLYGAGRHVVDVDRRRIVRALADSTAGGGFAIAPELGRGVVRNGTVFMLASGTTIRKLTAQGDASLYEPVTRRVFLLDDSVSVIDVKSASLVTKISVPGAHESGVADGQGMIFLNLAGRDSIAIIDARTLTTVGEYSVSPAKSPMGLAIDSKHHRLFAACDGQVVVLDATDGRVVARIPTPGQSDQNAFDPETDLLFEPGGKDGITIIHEDSPDRYSIVQKLVGPKVTSATVVVDPKSHVVYVPRFTAANQFIYVVLAPTRR
jgi:outer membrane protein assembly factor BamB